MNIVFFNRRIDLSFQNNLKPCNFANFGRIEIHPFMNNRTKNILYTAMLLAALVAVYQFRKTNALHLVAFTGKTMGPIAYNIKYFDAEERDLQLQVDSVLEKFNRSLNNYRPESEITTFNRQNSFNFRLPYFYPVLEKSREIHQLSEGAFDPTLGPIIKAWGFGPGEARPPDSAGVDALMVSVGFEKIKFDENRVEKQDENIQLDFGAIAKGYGVDVVSEYLKDQGIDNYFVEIGGEVRCAGRNLQSNKPWKVGILDPNSTELEQSFIATIDLEDKGMATSGNYFNYRIIDGMKYSHTISPFTGYPIALPILSASVVTDDCMTADGLATAFMVLGHEKAIEILENNEHIDAFLVFSDGQGGMSTYVSNGIAESVNQSIDAP